MYLFKSIYRHFARVNGKSNLFLISVYLQCVFITIIKTQEPLNVPHGDSKSLENSHTPKIGKFSIQYWYQKV